MEGSDRPAPEPDLLRDGGLLRADLVGAGGFTICHFPPLFDALIV